MGPKSNEWLSLLEIGERDLRLGETQGRNPCEDGGKDERSISTTKER